jgi:hypothetical protein
MTIFCIAIYAQNDITTFLGIPVDGYKTDMIKKLIAKGFQQRELEGKEFLEGEFNGTDVNIHLGTNNNKVYRIMVCDKNTLSEGDIKTRFNNLVYQFMNNKRYTYLDNYTLSDSEDISYEMGVNQKKYEAIFYQVPDTEKIDTLVMQSQIKDELLAMYTPEQIKNPTEEIQQEVKKIAISKTLDLLFKKTVWFCICEYYGEYYITIYYDNEYNKANGEDL